MRVGGSEGNFQLARSGVQGCLCRCESNGCPYYEVSLDLPGLELVFAKFNGVVAGIDGCHGERAIGLHGSNWSLVDENGSSGNSALDSERRQVRDGLQIENYLGLLAFADADFLFRLVLETALGDANHVVLDSRFGMRNWPP